MWNLDSTLTSSHVTWWGGRHHIIHSHHDIRLYIIICIYIYIYINNSSKFVSLFWIYQAVVLVVITWLHPPQPEAFLFPDCCVVKNNNNNRRVGGSILTSRCPWARYWTPVGCSNGVWTGCVNSWAQQCLRVLLIGATSLLMRRSVYNCVCEGVVKFFVWSVEQ